MVGTRTLRSLVAYVLLGLAVCAPAFAQQVIPDAEIRAIIAERIDKQRQSVGIVVGVVEPAGRRVVAYGAPGGVNTRSLDGDTFFLVGSVTKIFTSLLLSDMAQKKEVKLEDPVQRLLPAGVQVPTRNGRAITLLDLATQTSGLPRLPPNFKPADPTNPYVDYTSSQLYEFLKGYPLPRDPGAQYEYSNLGFGLLGHALALRANKDYEALVLARICKPLGMKDTLMTISPDIKLRLASGHNGQLQPVPDWEFNVLAGAGALRSTANDLMIFLAANIGLNESPLTPALKSMQTPRRPTPIPETQIGLGWNIRTKNGGTIVWHNGGTSGFASFVGFDPQRRTGVVVLSNTFTAHQYGMGVDDIGMHLLDPQSPLAKIEPPKERKAIDVDRKVLENYVGRYELAPNFVLTVTLEDGRLFAQATDQEKAELFAESTTQFFYKIVDAQITFKPDASGRATDLTLHQMGREFPAKRLP